MKIDLTFEQATALGKAVGLVLEHLEVTECEIKSFKKAREALYQSIGYDEILENSQKDRTKLANFLLYTTRPKSFYTHCGEEFRGDFGYKQKEGVVEVYLYIYRFDDDERVEVVCGETGISAEDTGDMTSNWLFTWRPMAKSFEIYAFDVSFGSHVTVTVSTPTSVKKATYLVTEQGVEEQSDTIWLEIRKEP